MTIEELQAHAWECGTCLTASREGPISVYCAEITEKILKERDALVGKVKWQAYRIDGVEYPNPSAAAMAMVGERDELKEELESMSSERDTWRSRCVGRDVYVHSITGTLHKISCGECAVHDEHCEMVNPLGSDYCACDARLAGKTLGEYKCPVAAKDQAEDEKDV